METLLSAGAITIDFELLIICMGLALPGGDDVEEAVFADDGEPELDSIQLVGAGGILAGLTMTSNLLELINSGAF